MNNWHKQKKFDKMIMKTLQCCNTENKYRWIGPTEKICKKIKIISLYYSKSMLVGLARTNFKDKFNACHSFYTPFL